MRYASLHNHSWYSLLEGADSPLALARRAKEAGCWALALTDANNLYGAVEHADACRQFGIKPIIGVRLRAPDTKRRATVLVAEPAGWPSLCRVVSRLQLRVKVDLALFLKESSHGLVVLADDLEFIKDLLPSYGHRLWLEVVRPGREAMQERALITEAKRLGARPVASLGAHYANAERSRIGRLLAAVKSGATVEGHAVKAIAGP